MPSNTRWLTTVVTRAFTKYIGGKPTFRTHVIFRYVTVVNNVLVDLVDQNGRLVSSTLMPTHIVLGSRTATSLINNISFGRGRAYGIPQPQPYPSFKLTRFV